ncbi:HD-GYP domain-containing protein [Aquibacillus kalidii]|uniref:HD-GYP domain-containing protein n=1 Tax=Aquibacillus kalidii TaxID=2762597 RepID=UPI001648BCE9|nr:HD-GYP domain-containing protein [Aquibacillus kalidii]
MQIYHNQADLNPSLKLVIKYRYIFFTIAALVIWLEGFIHSDRNLVIIYSLVMILLGSIYRSKWILLYLSSLVTLTRYLVIPDNLNGIDSFIYLWVTYFVIALITSTLISKYVTQHQANIQLSTTLAKLLDSRDPYTATHSENVANFSTIIAKRLKLSKQVQENIYLGGLLHDIGKIVIPDIILNKPSKLNKEEFEIIKQHPKIGYETLKHIAAFKERGILDMVLYHHERYDGMGYPHGLKGEEIPLVAKIIAVADAFDAMTSKRVYRNAKDIEVVLEEFDKNKGKQFDPLVADTFLAYLHENKNQLFSSDKLLTKVQ